MLAGGAPIRPWKREDMDREAGSREEDASPGDAGGPGAKVADATRVRAVIRPRVSARRRMVAIRKPPPPRPSLRPLEKGGVSREVELGGGTK